MTKTLTNPATPAAKTARRKPARGPVRLSSHVAGKGVVMLVNPLSGGVDDNAVAEATAILSDHGCDATVITLESGRLEAQVDEALAAGPDVLLVLAGDGTAGTIAARVGPNGPLVAPLPGGTMNMLPQALYGTTDWKTALGLVLEEGVPLNVGGGEITDLDGRYAFYCAAILGSPALWAPAREAIRSGRLKLAWGYARRALRRAFSGRLRFALDARGFRRAGPRPVHRLATRPYGQHHRHPSRPGPGPLPHSGGHRR